MVTIPTFSDLSKTHDWLIANKLKMIDQKKATLKFGDGCFQLAKLLEIKEIAQKGAVGSVPKSAKKITVTSIINTTKLFDSHGDVHIDGLWSKSLKENK